jgi:hypothetical protein
MGDQLTICVDLDGCLARYDGWRGQEHIGDPLPGALAAIRELHAAGHRLIIYTCRCGNYEREQYGDGLSREQSAEIVRAWLSRHGFPGELDVYLGDGKPMADMYVDDKAVRVAPQEITYAWASMLHTLGLPAAHQVWQETYRELQAAEDEA